MPSPAQDLAFFEAGVQEIPDYLLSKDLFWPLSVSRSDLPRLTIGGLLLARRRLGVRSSSPAEAPGLERLEARLDAIRERWRSAWEAKAGREVRARLDLWSNYLNDYRLAPETHAAGYPQEVRWRVMLHLLWDELPVIPPEAEALAGLDQVLKARFAPGKFVWEADLAPAFPPDVFWFLYGTLIA